MLQMHKKQNIGQKLKTDIFKRQRLTQYKAPLDEKAVKRGRPHDEEPISKTKHKQTTLDIIKERCNKTSVVTTTVFCQSHIS